MLDIVCVTAVNLVIVGKLCQIKSERGEYSRNVHAIFVSLGYEELVQ